MMDSDISTSQQTSNAPVTLETVVTDYETALLRYAARILNNHATAQDVVQNVFIKLARAWETDAKPSIHLKSWLYRATHNEAVDHIRGESRRSELHLDSVSSEQSAVSSEEEDRMAVVLRHLGALHPRERQIVLLRLEEGLSYTEISAITGRTEGNVGNILHHAIKKLSESIKTGKSGGLGETSLPPESKVGRDLRARRLDISSFQGLHLFQAWFLRTHPKTDATERVPPEDSVGGTRSVASVFLLLGSPS